MAEANTPRGARILVLIPYFGRWPEWMDVFVETCRWNSTIDWLLLTDQPPPRRQSPNVRYQPMTITAFANRVEQRLGYPVPIPRPYKICDLRLTFPLLFEDLARGYDYLGWSDVDLVYGDLRAYLEPEVLRHDLVTFNAVHVSGHLCLVRNDPRVWDLPAAIPDWKVKLVSPEYQHLDEPAPEIFAGRFAVYARESFNTPLSPVIPWRDGRFVFPREWYWRGGKLTNDLDRGVEFPYLHFMHWKGGDWPRQCGNAQWERLERVVHLDPDRIERGFRVNEHGFFPLENGAAMPTNTA